MLPPPKPASFLTAWCGEVIVTSLGDSRTWLKLCLSGWHRALLKPDNCVEIAIDMMCLIPDSTLQVWDCHPVITGSWHFLMWFMEQRVCVEGRKNKCVSRSRIHLVGAELCLHPNAKFICWSPNPQHLRVQGQGIFPHPGTEPASPALQVDSLPLFTIFYPWVKKIPGEGNGNPLQYSCLENSMDRGAWRAIVHGVAKGQTRLSN